MLLYHGTNASNPETVLDNPTLQASLNGVGFYLTNDINVARQYGRSILTYDVQHDIELTVRPIDQRYTEDMSLYRECASNGLEFVVTTQHALNSLVLDCEDAFVQH